MTLRYTYHSEHHADRQDRWVHFLLFAGAFLLLIGGVYELFLFFTDWTHDAQEHSWWHLVISLLYLLLGGLLAYAGIRHVHAGKHHPSERYVRVDDERLVWRLDQLDTEQRVPLASIASVHQPSIRDLVITLRDGSRRTLPIYLVTNSEKQEELVRELNSVATGVKGQG